MANATCHVADVEGHVWYGTWRWREGHVAHQPLVCGGRSICMNE